MADNNRCHGRCHVSENQEYSYFKKRCQKESKHPISRDRKVVWVVFPHVVLLLHEERKTRKNWTKLLL